MGLDKFVEAWSQSEWNDLVQRPSGHHSLESIGPGPEGLAPNAVGSTWVQTWF